jgi:sigma-B regulation protein RsbU (phosphoserine phosphatase)
MSDEKLMALYAQVAEKIKIEQEVQTAEIVQKSFFPSAPLNHPKLRVAGNSTPATQCSGDWWQYDVVGNQVIIVIGDVLGHGVAAALITAAIQSAFTIFVSQARESESVSIAQLSRYLDIAVRVGGASNATMSLFCVLIDLKKDTLTYLNRSHCKPFLLNPFSSAPQERIRLLSGATVPLVGLPSPKSEEMTCAIPYRPGEVLFLYTDGFFDNLRKGDERTKRVPILERVMELSLQAGTTPTEICDDLKDQVRRDLLQEQAEVVDDMTMVICQFLGVEAFIAPVKLKGSDPVVG